MSFIRKVVRNIVRTRFNCPQLSSASFNAQNDNKRFFGSSSKLCGKMFMEHENNYAFNFMKSKGYTSIDLNTVINIPHLNHEQFKKIMEQDWSQVSHKDLLEVFPKFGKYCAENNLCISNAMFDNYIDQLTDNLRYVDDAQLHSTFYSLSQWPETSSVRTRNYIEVWAALDDACLGRLINWSHEELLTFISLFFMINVTKGSDFFNKAIQKLATRAKHLTPQQLVQTLFFVGVRRIPPHNMHNLEEQLSKHFDAFSVDDLAVMSMGFFKSKTPIRNLELVEKMINVIISNVHDIHEVSLTALLKIVRYSMKIPNTALINKLLDCLTPEIPRLSMMCNVHMALLSASKLILHKPILDSIAVNVTNNLENLRLKDIERLVLSYGSLGYTPKVENFFEKLLDELRTPEKQSQIERHGITFACCVSFFGLVDMYPVDLIDYVLDKTFLHQTYGKNCFNFGKEILVINNYAEMYCKDSVKNLLTEKESIIMAKKYTDFMPNEGFIKEYNFVERMIIDTLKILREIRGGEEYAIGDHILPHHQRGDIILCNTPDGVPVPISDKQFSAFGTIRKPPDNNKWIVLALAGRNAIINDTNRLSGLFKHKLEELRSLGYHANMINWVTYSKLDTLEKKISYLTQVLDEAT